MEAGSFVAYNLVGSRIYVDNDKKWEIHPLFAGRREENLGHEVRWKVILPYLEARWGRGRCGKRSIWRLGLPVTLLLLKI